MPIYLRCRIEPFRRHQRSRFHRQTGRILDVDLRLGVRPSMAVRLHVRIYHADSAFAKA